MEFDVHCRMLWNFNKQALKASRRSQHFSDTRFNCILAVFSFSVRDYSQSMFYFQNISISVSFYTTVLRMRSEAIL